MKGKFSAIKNLRQEISALKEKIKFLDDSLTNMTATLDGLPKAQSKDDRTARLIAAKVDLQRLLEEKTTDLAVLRADVTCYLFARQSLSNGELKVLLLRYVDCLPFAEIARQMKFSENRIFEHHRRGLKKLCD